MKIIFLAIFFGVIFNSNSFEDKKIPKYYERQVMPQSFQSNINSKNSVNSIIKSGENNSSKKSTSKKNKESNLITEKNYLRDTLFFESFSGKSLDNEWQFDSSIDNMEGYIDSTMGKVLKITNKYEGDSYLRYNLLNKLKGKKIRLEGWVKTENISGGNKEYEVGKLRLSYQVGQKIIYEDSKSLFGSKNWQKLRAQEDCSTSIDDAGLGNHIFFVPENAENIELLLGLQNCKGTIYFKDIILTEIKE